MKDNFEVSHKFEKPMKNICWVTEKFEKTIKNIFKVPEKFENPGRLFFLATFISRSVIGSQHDQICRIGHRTLHQIILLHLQPVTFTRLVRTLKPESKDQLLPRRKKSDHLSVVRILNIFSLERKCRKMTRIFRLVVLSKQRPFTIHYTTQDFLYEVALMRLKCKT